MNAEKQKLVQYLGEAQASERGLVRELQAQIAMTPRGRYRTASNGISEETRDHADRVGARRSEIGGADPLSATVALAEAAVAQTLALGRTPLNLLRGTGGEEKVLKNAKDAARRRGAGDRHLHRDRAARPIGRRPDDRAAGGLDPCRGGADARADPRRDPAADRRSSARRSRTSRATTSPRRAPPTPSGEAGTTAKRSAGRAQKATRRTARQARKVPGVARAEGRVKGAVASAGDLAIAQLRQPQRRRASRRACPSLSQIDLAKIDAYERRARSRVTILSRIERAPRDEPWPGYDELNADEIRSALSAGDDAGRREDPRVRARAQEPRRRAADATERELSRT